MNYDGRKKKMLHKLRMGKNFLKHPEDQGGELKIILLLRDIGSDNVSLMELAKYSVQW
jgi:hypothetical protein